MFVEAASAAALAGGAGYLAWGVRGRSATLFGPSHWRGDRKRAAIALTFDDGPSESTPELLAILAEHHIQATFFLCGRNVRRLPAIARQVREAGHEIGNHSDSHPRLDFKSPEFIYRELAVAQESIKQIAGAAPRYFRAPYGVRWFGLRTALRRLHLEGLMWTVIGRDWTRPAEAVVREVLSGAANGAIICLHDGRATQKNPDVRNTLDAVRRLVPELAGRGYQFDTVSRILCPKN